jgi:hypothetical protein
MKHLIITALLAVSLFVTAPTAKAADWNNDKLSCNIKVTNTFFGKWIDFSTEFYLTAKPEVFYTYRCKKTSDLINNLYSCEPTSARGGWYNRSQELVLEFAPGITQKQTCEKMFTKIHPTPM